MNWNELVHKKVIAKQTVLCGLNREAVQSISLTNYVTCPKCKELMTK